MGILDWFYEDPADESSKYLEKIPGQTRQYFDPFIQRGQRAGGILEGQYGNLINDPGGMLNKFGEGYQKSPGFDFALQRALESAGRGAAAGGMAGSPMHQEQNMGIATGMANQDYYNWLDRTLGMYGHGLAGEESALGRGYGASQSMADMIAQMLAGQAGLQFAGTQGRNQMIGDLIKSLLSGGGAAAGAFAKGAAGGM